MPEHESHFPPPCKPSNSRPNFTINGAHAPTAILKSDLRLDDSCAPMRSAFTSIRINSRKDGGLVLPHQLFSPREEPNMMLFSLLQAHPTMLSLIHTVLFFSEDKETMPSNYQSIEPTMGVD